MLELFYFGFLLSVPAEVAASLPFTNYFGVNAFGHFNNAVSDELKVIQSRTVLTIFPFRIRKVIGLIQHEA